MHSIQTEWKLDSPTLFKLEEEEIIKNELPITSGEVANMDQHNMPQPAIKSMSSCTTGFNDVMTLIITTLNLSMNYSKNLKLL